MVGAQHKKGGLVLGEGGGGGGGGGGGEGGGEGTGEERGGEERGAGMTELGARFSGR